MKVLKSKVSDTGVKLVKVQDLRKLERVSFAPKGQILNNKKNQMRDIQMSGSLSFVRDNKDPQQFGKIWLAESEYNQLRNKPCIFCNEVDCLYFYFRESFYKMIDYCLANNESFTNFCTQLNKIDWDQIQNQDDIFMPAKNATNQKFDLIKLVQEQTHLPTNDWFQWKWNDQLRHESKTRAYVLKNKIQSVIVNGQEHRLSKESFKINFNPQELYKPCNLCKKTISCGFKSYIGLLKVAQQIRENSYEFPQYPQFTDDSQLLIAQNWSQLASAPGNVARYRFTYLKMRVDLKDDYVMMGHKNFITCFIEHVKALQGPYQQLKANPAAKQFCFSFRCTNLADKQCGRCKKVWYCSVDHQKSDWSTHKTICQSSQIIIKEKILNQQDTNNKILSKSTAQNLQTPNEDQIVNSTDIYKTDLQEKLQPNKFEQQSVSQASQSIKDYQKSLNQEKSQNVNEKNEVILEDLVSKQKLLLSYQSILTPNHSEASCKSQTNDTNTDQSNQQQWPNKSQLPQEKEEETKEPQDDGVKQQDNQTNYLQTTPYPTQEQLNDLEHRVQQLEKSKFDLEKNKFDLQKENLKLNEKVLNLEQEQFELSQQVKLLMRKMA